MVAHEADDFLRDHLFRGEVGAVEAGQVVAPETGRSRDAIGKIIEGFRRAAGSRLGRKARSSAESASPARIFLSKARRRTERELDETGAQSRAQPVAPRRRPSWSSNCGVEISCALPLVEERLLGRREVRSSRARRAPRCPATSRRCARRTGSRSRILSSGRNRSRRLRRTLRGPGVLLGAVGGASTDGKLRQRWFAGIRNHS